MRRIQRIALNAILWRGRMGDTAVPVAKHEVIRQGVEKRQARSEGRRMAVAPTSTSLRENAVEPLTYSFPTPALHKDKNKIVQRPAFLLGVQDQITSAW